MRHPTDNAMTPEQSRIALACSGFDPTFRLVGMEGVFRVTPIGSYIDAGGEVVLSLQRRGDSGWWTCGQATEAQLQACLPGVKQGQGKPAKDGQ